MCEQLVAPNEWEGEAEEEINIEDEERSEEVEPARVAPDPGQPTAKQLADHNVTHSLPLPDVVQILHHGPRARIPAWPFQSQR